MAMCFREVLVDNWAAEEYDKELEEKEVKYR